MLRLDNWKMIPTADGSVSAIGDVGTRIYWMTLRITGVRWRQVMAESGTVYILGDPLPGAWVEYLATYRPIFHALMVRHKNI